MNQNKKADLIEKYRHERLEEDVEYSINLGMHLGNLYRMISDFANTFECRTELFFILFKEMLRRGHLKLQRDGKIIEHSPEEWEEIFRAAWPRKVDGIWQNTGDIIDFEEDDMSIWFIADECPAYAVWVDPETGEYEWST